MTRAAKVVALTEGDLARIKIGKKKTAHEYDMSSPSILKFGGTMLPLILVRWELWFFVLAHIALIIVYRLGLDEEYDSIPSIELDPTYDAPWNIIKIPTGLLTFFLVFFNGTCYGRYVGYYNAHCAIGGKLQEITAQVLTCLLYTSPSPRDRQKSRMPSSA